eukprot:CAMPEP_0115703070 /NCGR_PEP_ID=MMETSP0272-20121206/68891_1 /TAXON_ID=71861 /ORGANISM="Scrippsiella trochoidea, Strain CCMP3099" /LENGTH=325 /DNA_ID=CAMNT_0003143887 /DNA_START=111 /DNA_END=1090 /DNA_ORIENTATION=-
MASGGFGSMQGSAYGSGAPPPPPPPAAARLGAAPPSYVQGPQPDRLPSEHSLLRSGGTNGYPKGSVNIWELIIVPWLFLALILALQGGANGYYVTLVTIPVVLLFLNGWFLRFHYTRGNNPEVVLGILVLTAIVISLSVGVYSVAKSLVEYHRLSQGASYFNVLPSESAAGKIDATTLAFTNASLVDGTRAFGFTDAHATIPVIIVLPPSPMASSSSKGSSIGLRVWIAARHAATSPATARTPMMHTAGLTQNLAGFRSAILGAQGEYGVTAGDHYLLLKWVSNPVAYRDSLWKNTATLFLIFGGVYLVISSMIGCALIPVITPK